VAQGAALHLQCHFFMILCIMEFTFRRTLRTRLSRSQAWQSWWREERPSTFNAIIARDCPADGKLNGQTSGGGRCRSSSGSSSTGMPRSIPLALSHAHLLFSTALCV